MSYTVKFERAAAKALAKMEKPDAKRIVEAIERLAVHPFAPGLPVKKLRARDGYRFRAGSWRVLYLIDGDAMVIVVVGIADRKEAYR